MRKEPFDVGSFIHIYNRGNRKQPIVRDTKDRLRFILMLRYFNDEYSPPYIFRAWQKSDFYKQLAWPTEWPSHKPIVKIPAFSLLENHFHLLLKEIREGGTTMFMRKIGTGMTNYFNAKYKEVGRLFQGAYKAKTIKEDLYLQYVSVYIQVKNIFEFYPGGVKKALNEFDKAFKFSVEYPYGSLESYATTKVSPLIDKDILEELFPTPKSYKRFTRDSLIGTNFDKLIGDLAIEKTEDL